MYDKRPILITRASPQNEKSAAKWRKKGFNIICAPLFALSPIREEKILDIKPEDKYGAIIISSKNAIISLKLSGQMNKLKNLPIYSVGKISAKKAKKEGFEKVFSAKGDIDSLLKLIKEHKENLSSPLLYLRGKNITKNIKPILKNHAIIVEEQIIYEMQPIEKSQQIITDFLKNNKPSIINIYSLRGAETILKQIRQIKRQVGGRVNFSNIIFICIAKKLADIFINSYGAKILISEEKNESAMMDLAHLVNND